MAIAQESAPAACGLPVAVVGICQRRADNEDMRFDHDLIPPVLPVLPVLPAMPAMLMPLMPLVLLVLRLLRLQGLPPSLATAIARRAAA